MRIKSFFKWLLMGSSMTSGNRNFMIAAHGADLSVPSKGDSGTVMSVENDPGFIEQAETPEERSRRLKRERDRRYKAKKKAKTTVGLVDAYA